MRKWIVLLFAFLALLALPVGAHAQTDIVLDEMLIQLWPDHDQQAVLVIYDFKLSADTTLPATVRFQMPASGNLVAVAKSSDVGLLTVEASTTTEGAMSTVTLSIVDQAAYHIEYYMPYQLEGTTRNFAFTWPGDYAVKAFRVVLQKPTAATDLTTDPALSELSKDADGFSYLSTDVATLAAQANFTLRVRYQNDTNTLSASNLTVQPSSSLTEDIEGQVSLTTYLPWILAVLAVILIVGGFGWYWFSSRGSGVYPPREQRRVARRRKAERTVEAGGGQIYCHQCGQRARPDDRFCRTCGAQLRQPE